MFPLLLHYDAHDIDGDGIPNAGDTHGSDIGDDSDATWGDLQGLNNGTLSNFTLPSSAASGWDGDGTTGDPYRLKFDGSNDIVVPGSTVSNPRAFAVWFTLNTISTYNDYIFRHDNGGTYLVNQYGTLLAGYNGGGTQRTSISDNTWYHYVVTNDGATTRFYLNGVEFASEARAADTGNTALEIGYTSQYAEYLDGAINDFRVYATGLSTADVLSLYESGRTRFTADPGVVQVDRITPGVGPIGGGATVTIYGWNFLTDNVTSVTFGGTAGTGLDVISDSKLTVVAPANAAGWADVAVVGDTTDVKTAAFLYASTVTDDALVWLDAANIDGTGGHGDGSTNSLWTNLVGERDAGVVNFTHPTSGSSGWDGDGSHRRPLSPAIRRLQ